MENLNNLYNFKNPIRHFFNIEELIFKNDNIEFEDLSWTKPIDFKIFKTEDSVRVIKFPNILNYFALVKLFETEQDFFHIQKMSNKKRVNPNLDIGEFSVLSYNNAIQNDYFNLLKYDKLLILDIKSFYGRIYLHDLKFKDPTKRQEQIIGSLNSGRTNGLLLGSYLSLYLAEKYLLDIETNLIKEFANKNIDCHFEYFSDDFYFFCNSKDIENIKSIFASILENKELQINYDKTQILDFDEYSKDNNLDKLWKKIINISKQKDKETADKQKTNKDYLQYPSFFTQLVYRLSQISNSKLKRVFLVNFFKTAYFQSIDSKKYCLSDSDLNYICYIYKLMPECIIYSLHKVRRMINFNTRIFKDFIISRFKSSLFLKKQEEQVYFYYAAKICGFNNELISLKKEIIDTKNQILISYCLMDKIIQKKDFKLERKEENWLQNYHYILLYAKNKIEYLVPEKACDKEIKKQAYIDFYKNNLDKNISIIRPIEEIQQSIEDYMKKRLDSYRI